MVADTARLKNIKPEELIQQPFYIVPKQIPCIQLQLDAQTIQHMLTHLPRQLEEMKQSLEQKVTRFQSASSVRQQYQAIEKELAKLVQNEAVIGQPISAESARILYDQVAYYLEWLMKEVVYNQQETLLSFTEKNWNEKKNIDDFLTACHTWFETIFHVTPTLKKVDLQQDWLGISDDGITYNYHLFAGYDVLYDFKTMFKTADVPGFILNLSKFLVRDTTRGKTKTALTEFAYSRVIKGLGIYPDEDHLFCYRYNPLFQLSCSDFALPYLTERKRYMIYAMYDLRQNPISPFVQYDERKYGATIHAENNELKEAYANITPRFLACSYTEKEQGQLDFDRIPIQAMWLEDEAALRAFIQQDSQYPAFTHVLIEQFLKRIEGGK